MRYKSEIKVYLPIQMIGELEQKKKYGKRSEFIEKAIRDRLDDERSFSLADVETKYIMAVLTSRLTDRNDAQAYILQEMLRQEMENNEV